MKSDIRGKLCSCLIYIYILFVLWGQYALFDSVFPAPLVMIGILFVTFLLTRVLMKWCASWEIKFDVEAPDKKEIKKMALLIFAVSFGIMLVFYFAYFPGIYFMDSIYQLNQSISGNYDDWHPLLYTLLAYTIPYKVAGVWLIELLQIIFFCAGLTYMICSLRWYRCPRWMCVLVFAFIMLHPDTAYILMFPMKDCAFAIITMILMTEVLHIVCSKGKWIRKKWNVALFVTTWVVGTIVRHNAILFTAPVLLLFVVYARKNKKNLCFVLISVVSLFLLVKIPFYGAFHMKPNEYRVTETMGMSMVMMGNVLCEMPEYMGDEAKNFMYKVQDKKVWEREYKLGDWNLVKSFDGGADFDVMDEYGRGKIMKYTIDTIASCPEHAMRAFLAVTGMVWQIDGEHRWEYSLRKYYNNFNGSPYDDTAATETLKKYNFDSELRDTIKDAQSVYIDVCNKSILKYIFCFVGLLDLLLILVSISKVKFGCGIKKLLFVLPILCYNFGTALLLSAYDNRFFYYTNVCFFVSMFLLLRNEKDD